MTGGVVIPLRYESYRSGGNNSKFSFTKIRKLRTFEAVKRSSVFFKNQQYVCDSKTRLSFYTIRFM